MLHTFLIKMFRAIIVLILSSKCCNANVVSFGRDVSDSAITSTFTTTQTITSLVPSSCVQVEATLPKCKSALSLAFPRVISEPVEEIIYNWRTEPNIESTPLSWGEYFGFYKPTVTMTVTDLRIVEVKDTSLLVTYAIKGCKPLNMPMDIDRCPPDTTTLSIEEVLPTVTASPAAVSTEKFLPTKTVTPEYVLPSTAYAEMFYKLDEQSNFPDYFNLLEPSTQEHAENANVEATEAL